MFEVRRTDEFATWLKKLRDAQARARIYLRIDRITLGNLGDTKSVGKNICELRIDYGPGYRLYYTRCGKQIILLLLGGDKSTQSYDVKMAKKLASEYVVDEGLASETREGQESRDD
jgi:putative addiction module killer protein